MALSLLSASVRSDSRSLPLVVAAVVLAYLVGVPLMLSHRWDMPPRLAYATVVAGTVASTMVVAGGTPGLVGAHGGFYGYVAAYSFLYFGRRGAAAQWLLSGFAFGLSLWLAPVPNPGAQWVTVMGIAAGGAGLLGVLAARLRDQWEIEREANLREAELVKLRSTFLQAVSHELRTPLTAVLGFARTLDRHGTVLSPETVASMHGRIVERAEQLSTLLSDLLDLERLQRGDATARRAPTVIGTVMVNALQQVDHPAHTVRLHDELGSLELQVEAALVERMLVNLLANAVRHTPDGTSIDMTCDLIDGDLLIRVTDDGPGVPRELHATIFDPFIQGHDAAGQPSPGTGIGLGLVKHMAALHGGVATITDAPGGGADFRVLLPHVLPVPVRALAERSDA